MNPHTRPLRTPPALQQSGIVLPIVLIFLVIMTMIGITAIRNVTMEERMASASREQQLAFQSAEEALRFCERQILDPLILPKFYAAQFLPSMSNPTDPKYQLGTIETAATQYWLPPNGSWTVPNGQWLNATYTQTVPVKAGVTADGADFTNAGDELAARPQCMVEVLYQAALPTGGGGVVPTTTCPFRVTARGVGMDPNRVVVLQSYLIAPSGNGNGC